MKLDSVSSVVKINHGEHGDYTEGTEEKSPFIGVPQYRFPSFFLQTIKAVNFP